MYVDPHMTGDNRSIVKNPRALQARITLMDSAVAA